MSSFSPPEIIKSDAIIRMLPPEKGREFEVVYRNASDEWIQVEYGLEQKFNLKKGGFLKRLIKKLNNVKVRRR